MTSEATHLDVLIIGAGLSGIDAAAHIAKAFPGRNYAVLEQRHELGGTWSLFKYPGIRSDSDMFTLGFGWKPWNGDVAIADGPDILAYLKEAARETGVDERIRYNHKVTKASWSSADKLWTVDVEHPPSTEGAGGTPNDRGATSKLTADFVWWTSGYYDYDEAYTPEFPGVEDFKGQVIHPQFWPEDLDYTGKEVVVIGSGATAVTLIPSMSRDAGHITMLQRTPTYIMSVPQMLPAAKLARKVLPRELANKQMHKIYAGITIGTYQLMRRNPKLGKSIIKRSAQPFLPADFDYDTHLSPPYNPWEQRLCAVPGGDLFKAMHSHKVDMVTDHIDSFTADGIRLKSGRELKADIIITATGLKVVTMGKAALEVDGEPVKIGEHFTYKALMLNDIPNSAFTIGYSNASWTLKADLVCEYVVRLLDYMDEHNFQVVIPRVRGSLAPSPLMDLSSGYLQRAQGAMPIAGDKDPWRLKNNWYFDKRVIKHQPIEDESLEFA
ncbi:MAG: flavin-containing monooxygenase [Aeromicrobium sp.]